MFNVQLTVVFNYSLIIGVASIQVVAVLVGKNTLDLLAQVVQPEEISTA